MKLYIIGNGFDMAHGIPSSYSDFCDFMRENYHADYQRIGRYFFENVSELWSDFERNLTHLNIERLVRENIDIWKYQKSREIENTFDTEFSNLKAFFMEWVTSQFDNIQADRKYDLSRNDFYITFNYTPTLHIVYDVPNTRIIYIHENSVENNFVMPIVGHGESEEEIIKKVTTASEIIDRIVQESMKEDQGDYSYPIEGMIEVIKNEIVIFLNSLRKNTDDVIRRYDGFFQELGEHRDKITDVIVLGHSLSDVDLPYFRHIEQLLDVDTRWSIDYFPNDEVTKQRKLQRFRETMEFDAAAYELP